MPTVAPATPAPVSCSDDYEYVYRNHLKFLYGVVWHSGVPFYLVEEATAEIMLRMVASDGLDRFDGDVTASARDTRAYLASYYSLGARAELSRLQAHSQRTTPLDALPDLAEDPSLEFSDCQMLDDLLARTSGDARHFIEVCSENPTYSKSREVLTSEGWSTLRVRAAVREARRVARAYLCTPC